MGSQCVCRFTRVYAFPSTRWRWSCRGGETYSEGVEGSPWAREDRAKGHGNGRRRTSAYAGVRGRKLKETENVTQMNVGGITRGNNAGNLLVGNCGNSVFLRKQVHF